MSFTQQVKKEVVRRGITNTCCITAACYGAACFGKHFDDKGVVLHTEQRYIADWALRQFVQAGVRGAVVPRPGKAKGFEFAVKDPYEVDKLLALFAHSGSEPTLRLNAENILCDGCFAAFTAAAFLCVGVVVDPEKGYALEFVHPRYSLMRDFEALLQTHGFAPKYTLRNGVHVLYFKASEQIEDLLTLMGASNASLEIMNLKVYKDLRNKANRITNCETANIDKTVAANRRVLDAIDALEHTGALQALPQPLQQAARLRRENPGFSLAELVAASGEPLSKSGLSHRFARLIDLAERAEAPKTDKTP